MMASFVYLNDLKIGDNYLLRIAFGISELSILIAQ